MATATSTSSLLDLLGADLEVKCPSSGHAGKAAEILAGKTVLLYFSASWCGPCQQFSPLLKRLHKTLKEKATHDFEILFCSLDRSTSMYDTYTTGMPWYCLPFASPLITQLGTAYANGELAIPLLVVVDAHGKVILNDAVEKVTGDPTGTKFPWRPPPLSKVLPELYLDHASNLSPMSPDLDNKYILLYFSAHWCPPCRRFTPILSKAYTELKKHRSDFEFLFVSSDRSQESFDEYFSEMTFNSVPYMDRDVKAALSTRFQIRGIPALVMLGPMDASTGDRPIINENFHGVFEEDYVSDFPYHPRRYGDLSTTKDNINKFKCVIVFHELADDDEQEEIQTYLKDACDKCPNKFVHFYWGNSPEGLTTVVKDILKIGPAKEDPVMVILDVPEQGYYLCDHSNISTESILAFLADPGQKHMLQS